MLKVLVYLLPVSGEMLLRDFLESDRVSLAGAFLPESFISDCDSSRVLLRRRNVPCRVPSGFADEDHRDWVESLDADVGVSVGYDRKLPPWLVDSPRFGTLNMHPSRLPRYRGANPYFWILRNREKRTGVTLHLMDDQFDTGPVVSRETVTVREDETMGSLFIHLNSIGLDLINDCLNWIDEHRSRPPSSPQEPAEDPPRAPAVNDRHLRLDWTESYEELEAHVRAANPFYGAYTTFRGKRVRIYELRRVEGDAAPTGESPRPGDLHAHPEGPRIRCANAWTHPAVVQVGQQYTASGKTFQQREREAFEVLDRVI